MRHRRPETPARAFLADTAPQTVPHVHSLTHHRSDCPVLQFRSTRPIGLVVGDAMADVKLEPGVNSRPRVNGATIGSHVGATVCLVGKVTKVRHGDKGCGVEDRRRPHSPPHCIGL